jgi:phosphatidate cytidylyltransferase
MLRTRVVTAVVGGALLVTAIWLGSPVLTVALMALSAVAAFETCRLLFPDDHPFQIACGAIGGFLLLSVLSWGVPAFLIVLVLVFGAIINVRSNRYALFVFWLLYASVGFAAIGVLRAEAGGFAHVMLVFATIWVHDSVSYFAGRAFGKRKLAPTISPNKTVEGALVGFVCGVAFFAVAGTWVLLMSPATRVGAGMLVCAAALVGDLVESHLKRLCGAKDAGRILPGHGGILDRFDSAILVFSVYWVYHLAIQGALR